MSQVIRILNKIYNNHLLDRNSIAPEVYNLSLLASLYGSLTAAPLTGYAGSTAGLTATPDADCHFVDYEVTGGSINDNTFIYANNDATAKANFARNVHNNIVLTSDYGTITATPNTANSGDVVTLTNTPNDDCHFVNYEVTGATLSSDKYMVETEDVSARGVFARNIHNIALQTDGNGTLTATKTTGYSGDNIILTPTPNTNYTFSGYTITGATMTGDAFKVQTSDITAKAWFYQPVAKLADTSQYDLWVPKRSYSLHPTVENIGISINSDMYRYVVYSVQYTFYDNGFVLLRPDAQTSWPSIVNHWNIARYNDKIYIAQLSGTNSNYIANVDTWTNGNATVTSYVDGIDGMVAGNYVECTNSQYTNFAKLILDKLESRVSAYVAESDYSNWYTYQGCATVKTTADSTRLEAQCTSNENNRVNTHLKVYGCTAFSDATGCYYNK